MDFEVVRANRIAKGLDPDNESGWDWELLVRELSRDDSFEDRRSAAGSLWNRRRIWRLLSRARLGDAASEPVEAQPNIPPSFTPTEWPSSQHRSGHDTVDTNGQLSQ